MKLNNLTPIDGKENVRVGRGVGSGLGKTCGSGHKGAKARRGTRRPWFEGGQTPIHRRLPKFGFTSLQQTAYKKRYVISLTRLQQYIDNKLIDSNNTINLDLLKNCGIVKKYVSIFRVIGNEGLNNKINIAPHTISESAKTLVESVGGTVKCSVIKKFINKRKALSTKQ